MSKLLSPEEIATQAGGDATPNRLPSPRVFADRAARLRQLAQGHAMADFLAFAARLADAQQTLLDQRGPAPRPDDAHLRRCRHCFRTEGHARGTTCTNPTGWR